MYVLNDEQIEFVLDDIRRNGIEIEDLQLNLLDHICCIIENELEENGDFKLFYYSIVKRFYKGRLSEIEDETKLLLNNKYYYSMRKTMFISGAVSASLLTIGIIFKFLHWPASGVLVVSGTILFSLLFLPLLFTLRVKEKQQLRDKILLASGTVIAIMISLGILFKIMHWPGANMLGVSSLIAMVTIYIPIFFFSGIRNSESKPNTIITSILMIAGCGLFMALARTPHSSHLISVKETASFLRTERILEAEKKYVLEIKSTSANDVNRLSIAIIKNCDLLKKDILEWETGFKSLPEDFENKDALIGDGWTRTYFEDRQDARKLLHRLRSQISEYNDALKNMQPSHVLPVDAFDFDRSEEKVLAALTDISQVQMMVLQNLEKINEKI